MRSARTISLFAEHKDAPQRPFTFVLSVFAHVGGIALLSYGIIHAPKVADETRPPRFDVRHLDLNSPELKQRRANEKSIQAPGQQSQSQKTEASAKAAQGDAKAAPAAQRQMAQTGKAPRTLIQPDLPTPPKVPELPPLPTVVIWAAAKTPPKIILAPPPQPPTAAVARPSMTPPNEEAMLSDLGITATDKVARTVPVLPSSTTPLVVHGPDAPKVPLSTTSSNSQPTAATIVSISDLQMQKGAVVLPDANVTSSSDASGALAPGQSQNAGATGSQADKAGARNGAPGEGGNNGANAQARAGAAPGAADGSGIISRATTTRITRPKNEIYPAVIIGSDVQGQYPELSQIWSGRFAYTVYLHLGTAKSWILQYSLPRNAVAAGNSDRLEAPFPFDIVRPNLQEGSVDADAVMVHGFVNTSGRFEALVAAFPPQMAQAEFLLSALRQWQFRPATQNGHPATVEVLLIIPQE